MRRWSIVLNLVAHPRAERETPPILELRLEFAFEHVQHVPAVAPVVGQVARRVASQADPGVADLDGNGEYEIIVKWDPSNARDTASAGLTGRVLLDGRDVIDERHKSILPAHVWGDGDPEGVHARAAEDMKNCARAARQLGLGVVNGFTGSSIWHLLYSFPPVSPKMIDDGFKLLAERFNPILDVFGECGVKFALEVHPTEIAFDLYTTKRLLATFNGRLALGLNFDPSHLVWQGIEPHLFIREFADRIYHVHMKDVAVTLDGRSGILGSFLPFGDVKRGWNFRSLGHGDVDFDAVIRELNAAGYRGPLSVEWEDSGMEREYGAQEALAFVRKVDFAPSSIAFDDAMKKND